MPISLKTLCGRKLAASDGNIGHVDDFYFEDQRWAVRYVVADTGSWLPGRLVLISPYAFGHLAQCGDHLPVNLTRKQIEDSPATESHKPISRRYEESYHAYYQWPPYWNGGGLWGISSFPADLPPVDPGKQAGLDALPLDGEDTHLRSTLSLAGYDVQTRDGVIGRVSDFMVDEYSWMIRYVVVETGQWFSDHELVISSKDVARISYEQAKVFVNLTKETILGSSGYKLPASSYEDAPAVTR